MFKRVEKRRRKQEEEEELGLDEDLKDVLGINDTDSDESDSDEDDSSQDEGDTAQGPLQDEDAGDESEQQEEEESSDEDSPLQERPPIPVREALRNPVYVVSVMPDVRACIACPGKLLKTVEMVVAHKASSTHQRRFVKFSALVKNANPNSNAWDHLPAQTIPGIPATSTTTTSSKRAQKKEQASSKFQAKRERRKALAKAKKDGTALIVPKVNRKAKRAAAANQVALKTSTTPSPITRPASELTGRKKRRKDANITKLPE